MRILVLNGPNLQMLGKRETEVYGELTLAEMMEHLRAQADDLGVETETFQSNHEGELVSRIGDSAGNYDGILFNPAAYTHTSVALLDALKATDIPCMEVHISNTAAREDFRQRSITAAACIGQITGLGLDSYLLGLKGLINYINRKQERDFK